MKIKSELDPSFHLIDTKDHLNPVNGVELLNPALTINGITVYPTFRYNGKHAGSSIWKPWGYGEVLDLQAGTAPTYNAGSPFLGNMDDSALFKGSGGGSYRSRNYTFGRVGTDDFVIECVVKVGKEVGYIIWKRTAGGGVGYHLYQEAGNIYEAIVDSSGQVNVTSSNLTPGTWVHVMVFNDRSGSGIIYINGLPGASQNISAKQLTLNSDGYMYVGGQPTSLYIYDSEVAYISIWNRSSWLDTHLQQSIASDRFAKLSGTYPKQARGTALDSTSITRRNSIATTSKLEKGVRKIYQVGSNWVRTTSRMDSNGKVCTGLVCEPSRIQLVKYSNEFTTGYTATELTATPLNFNGPLGTSTMAKIVPANNARRQRSLKTAAIAFAAGTRYCTSVFACTGSTRFCSLGAGNDATVDMARVTFDLQTGETKLDTVRGPAEAAYMEDWGNGVKRLVVIDSCVAGGNEYAYILPADNLTDEQIVGDGATVALYVSGLQVEAGDYPSTYLSSSSAAVTRVADSLQFSGLGNVGNIGSNYQGRIEFDFLIPNHDILTAYDMIRISDAGSANDQIKLSITTNDFISMVETSTGQTGATITNSSDIANGVCHKAVVTWENNLIKLSIDGVLIGTNTTCGIMPDALSQINIDTSLGIISNLKIYPFAKPIDEK